MPKANDPSCPLGFHPQFRRPNYCKRCFREYNEHKSVKDSSNTSINSLSYDRSSRWLDKKEDTSGSRDSLISTSRVKTEADSLSRSRSDLTRSNSEDDDRGSYTSRRPMSWSAQDLRKAVDEAKVQVRTTREDVTRHYGSSRSLSQDLGALSHLLHGNSSSVTKTVENEPQKTAENPPEKSTTEPSKPASSFSSFLFNKTKSPAKAPLQHANSLHVTPPNCRLENIKETSPLLTPRSSSSPTGRPISPSAKVDEGKPPIAPPRAATTSSEQEEKLSRSEKNKKIIQSLREVKSEDADASYVIRIRPKKDKEKEAKKVDLQPEVDRLHQENKEILKQVKELSEKTTKLESENKELATKKSKVVDTKKQDTTKLQNKIDVFDDEIKKKTREIKDLKKELEKKPPSNKIDKAAEDIRSKLSAAEQLCEELMDENEDYKKEVRTLENELEEMQDNFREDQADEYRDLKRELEQRAKDCRVLQFKLKKAERRTDTLERDKTEVEEKLKELQVGEDDIGRAERVKVMEKELSLAKEVSMKMHEEMEKMRGQLETAETDKNKLKERVQDNALLKPGAKVSRSQVLGRQGSQESADQVYRDLQDSIEREQDLKEQMRFSEEETKNFRKKLSRIEEENETLQMQLNKMSSKAKQTRQRSLERSGSQERGNSVERGTLSRQGSAEKPAPPIVNGDELDPTEMKIQFELNEQESVVLRRKVEDLESENMRLQKEMKELLSSADSKKTDFNNTSTETTKDTIHFTKKVQFLERETSELKKKLVDNDKEREKLKMDLEAAKKRTRIVKSRSLELAEEEDCKKQDAYQKEINIIKDKYIEMEDKYDQIMDENKRLSLKAQRRLPLSTQENVYIEKNVLEDKVKRIEKRLKDALEKSKGSIMNSIPSKVVDTPNGTSGSQLNELQSRIGQLELHNKCLSDENEQIKSGTPFAERTPKKPRDLTPKSTLVKWVNELETECAKLYAKIKLQETKESLLGKQDRTLERRGSVDEEMCHLLFNDCEKLRYETRNSKEAVKAKENELKVWKSKIFQTESELQTAQTAFQRWKDADKSLIKFAANEIHKFAEVAIFNPKSSTREALENLMKHCATLHVALKDEKLKSHVSSPTAEEKARTRDLEDQLHCERERNEELSRQLKEEREKAEERIAEQQKQLRRRASACREDETIVALRKELEEQKAKYGALKEKENVSSIGFEELRNAQTEKHRLQKELASSQQSANNLERRLKECEETIKLSERTERNLRSILAKSEERLEDERSTQSTMEGRQKDMTMSWLKEREDLKKDISTAKRAKENIESDYTQMERSKRGLEDRLHAGHKKLEETEEKLKAEVEELKKIRKRNDALLIQLEEERDTIVKMEKDKERAAGRQEKEANQLRKEKEDLSIRMATLETELKIEKKKRERLERDSFQTKSSEMDELKDKLMRAERDKDKQKTDFGTTKQELDFKILGLERKLNKERRQVEKLQTEAESLEKESRLQKSQIDVMTNNGNRDSNSLQADYETVQCELRTLRETYVLHQDNWIKDKLQLQMQLKDLQEKPSCVVENSFSSERVRLKSIIEDKNHQMDNIKREMDVLKDQLNYYRRESEDLRKKLDDLEKLQELAEKHQSSVDTKPYEATIRELRTRLTALEKTTKAESTKTKMRYDTKVKSLSEEVSALTQHMTKYRRERDTYKEMLDGAQKAIAELKGSTVPSYRTSRADNMTEVAAAARRQVDHQAKAHLSEMLDLQSLVTELEDKLADNRLESTKFKNEIVDQKTNFEIQLSDMQTKLNEYEEDRLLGGGGRRVPGLRTRLELNWQKEREEQQRLIQDTATLAKDLRQTLYEVEREKDLERIDYQRKVDQLKRTVNQDHHDTKSKVQELQRDLQDLREAHAKLRQINEKLRREKDRTEVEREAMRDKFLGSSREHLNQQAKMEKLLDELKKLKDLSPLVLGEAIDGKEITLTNLPFGPKPLTKEEFTVALRRLTRTCEDLRLMMSLGDDRDRMRRTPSFRRALSAAPSDDESGDVRCHSAGRRGDERRSARRPLARGEMAQLRRKSQSLDHQLAEERGKIWVSTDAGSTSSIDSSRVDLDRSFDRISTGSQTSDVDAASLEQKKSKGLKGMFSALTKSRSIEDTDTAGTIIGVGMKALAPGMTGSGSSMASESSDKESNVKTRLRTLFKKAPSSRSQSVESEGPNVRKITSQFEREPASVSKRDDKMASTSIKR